MAFSLLSKASEMFSNSSFLEDSEESQEFMDYFLNQEALTDTSFWRVENSPPSQFSPLSSSNSSPPSIFPLIPEMPTISSPLSLFEDEIQVNDSKMEVKREVLLPKTSNTTFKSNNSKTLKSETRSLGNQDDERQLKRQRRLLKNRESAQLSRLRKKIYIEDLEKKVAQLNAQNETLIRQVNSISSDKKNLAEEVAYLRNVIKQSPHFTGFTPQSRRNPTNYKAAGVCLLLLLFSFGLLFNSAKRQEKTITWDSNSTKTEEIPETEFSAKCNTTYSPLIESLSETPLQSIDEKEKVSDFIPRKRSRSERENEDKSISMEVNSTPVISEIESSLTKKPKKETCCTESEIEFESPLEQSASVSIPSVPIAAPVPVPQPTNSSSSQDDMVALLIPSHMLNSSILAPHLQNSSTPSLQVLRQILTLYMWPMNAHTDP